MANKNNSVAAKKEAAPVIEKATKAKAKEIAEQLNVNVMYANSKGEYFTNDNLALLSEGGNKDKIQKFDFTLVESVSEPAKPTGEATNEPPVKEPAA